MRVWPFAFALMMVPSAAIADVDDDCIAASSQAASLQASGKLIEARAALLKCAAESCPAKVSAVCATRKDQVNAMIPTIVFDVKDAAGNDLTDVSITVDGVATTQAITSVFSANPGAHLYAFRASNKVSVEKTFVLRESERGRRETIVLANVEVATPNQPSQQWPPPVVKIEPKEAQPTTPFKHETSSGSGMRVLGGSLIGVGAAGLVVAGIFTGLYVSAHNQLIADCGGTLQNCAENTTTTNDRDTETTHSTVAWVTAAVGGVAVITGIVLFVTAPRSSPSTSAFRLAPTVGFRQAGLSLSGVF